MSERQSPDPIDPYENYRYLRREAPVHNRLRKLVSHAFKPSHIAAQRRLITRRCDELVQSMRERDEIELMSTLAAPLPVNVIAHMLGVVDGDMDTFKYRSDTMLSNIGDFLFAEPREEAQRCSDAMDACFLEQIAELRQYPGRLEADPKAPAAAV